MKQFTKGQSVLWRAPRGKWKPGTYYSGDEKDLEYPHIVVPRTEASIGLFLEFVSDRDIKLQEPSSPKD